MTYRYEFDDTGVGKFRFDRGRYELVQDSLRILQEELSAWNQRAREHGAVGEPYAQEVTDLSGMIEWGDARLVHSDSTEITVPGISFEVVATAGHAFFEKPDLQGLLGDDLFQRPRLTP